MYFNRKVKFIDSIVEKSLFDKKKENCILTQKQEKICCHLLEKGRNYTLISIANLLQEKLPYVSDEYILLFISD